ncbi:HupE/UreJ family protein [Bremerella sp. JC817]|uniref:HupE/UreJ family protein n=1 Tax=Bremerella sp. JC817 TaxID=3231756 RepID=UPI00345A1D7E
MNVARQLGALTLLLAFGSIAWAGSLDGIVTGSSFLDGILHPWFSAEHLLAMLAIGILAVHVEKGSIIAVPIVFLTSMLAGAGLNGSGIAIPWVETWVAISMIILGILLAVGWKYPELMLAIVVAGCGLFHGYAHGMIYRAPTLSLSLLAGLTIGCALVLALGIWIGHWIVASSIFSRCLGGGVILGGLVALFFVAGT